MNMRIQTGVAVLGLLVAAAASWGNGAADDPESGGAGAVQSDAAGLPEAPGREQTLKGCLGNCHQMGIFDQQYSAQEWQQCVDDMIALGAYIPDEDYVPIVLYLAKNLVKKDDAP